MVHAPFTPVPTATNVTGVNESTVTASKFVSANGPSAQLPNTAKPAESVVVLCAVVTIDPAPAVTNQLTLAPCTALPCPSSTPILGAIGSCEPASSRCPSPSTITIAPGPTPPVAVARNVAVSPGTTGVVASTSWLPTTWPRVQVTLDRPFASVTTVSAEIDPLPLATRKMIGTPGTPNPSLASTRATRGAS